MEGIKSINASNIHGYLNIELPFTHGMNIVYGQNGAGKTTLLHIIANISNKDLSKFSYIQFDSIRVEYFNGISISLFHKEMNARVECIVEVGDTVFDFWLSPSKEEENGGARRLSPDESSHHDSNLGAFMALEGLPRVTYFPAFRGTMAGLVLNMGESAFARPGVRARYYRIGERQKTVEAFLGKFVPKIDFVTTVEIGDELQQELLTAERRIYVEMQSTFYATFEDAISAILAPQEGKAEPEAILAKIRTTLENTLDSPIPVRPTSYGINFQAIREMLGKTRHTTLSADVSGVLQAYLHGFEKNYETIAKHSNVLTQFLSAANNFLPENKQLVLSTNDDVKPVRTSVRVKLPHGGIEPLSVLSSGEREVVSMLYAATHLSAKDMVLIDEPELSLHIDWQRVLMQRMADLVGNRQVIACTHSPQIGPDFDVVFSDEKFSVYGTIK